MEKQEDVTQSLKSFNTILWLSSLKLFAFKDELELAFKWGWILLVLYYRKTKSWKGHSYSEIWVKWNQRLQCFWELFFFHLKQLHPSFALSLLLCLSSVFDSIQLPERDYLCSFLSPSLKMLGRVSIFIMICVLASDQSIEVRKLIHIRAQKRQRKPHIYSLHLGNRLQASSPSLTWFLLVVWFFCFCHRVLYPDSPSLHRSFQMMGHLNDLYGLNQLLYKTLPRSLTSAPWTWIIGSWCIPTWDAQIPGTLAYIAKLRCPANDHMELLYQEGW